MTLQKSNPYLPMAIASLSNDVLQHITSDIYEHLLSPHLKHKV